MSCNTKIFGDFWRHELFMKGKQEKSEVVSVVGIQLEAVKDTLICVAHLSFKSLPTTYCQVEQRGGH